MILAMVAAVSTVRGNEETISPETKLAVVKAVEASLARVEWTLKFDKGEAPRAGGWSRRCPNCGRYHGEDMESLVTEERPLEAAGFVLTPREVITADPLIHPRFVKDIAVRFGEQVVRADATSYTLGQNAVILKLQEPLESAKALEFDAGR